MDNRLPNKQDLTEYIKDMMKEWREIVLPLHSILIWRQSFYPSVIVGLVTALFLLIWLSETSILTTFSLIGIIACLLDYLVPLFSRLLFDPSKWNKSKEDEYQRVCEKYAQSWIDLIESLHGLNEIKANSPVIYYCSVLSFLLVFAWIGNVINNLLLTYLIFLFVCLFPGLKHHGLIDKYFSFVSSRITHFTKKTK